MFKSVSGKSVILAAGLFFAVSVQVAQGQEVSEADIRALPGYKSYSTLGSFTERLRQDPALFNALQGNEALAERILGSTMAQRQVLSKIESSGDVQQALSGFADDSASNSSGSFSSQSADRQEKIRATTKKTDTRQRGRQRTQSSGSSFSSAGTVSSGGNNLAAQRAIERAQREREAANRRAGDIMAQAREILDREQSAEALALQQKEIIASNKAVAEVLAELSDQPEALQAFLSDGALVQKVMDKAVTLSEALEQVGADINENTASAGDAAVAENDTPVVASEPETSEPEVAPEQPDTANTQPEEPEVTSITQPEPEPVAENDNQQSLDDLLSTLEQVNPQAHTLLSQDSALQASVLSGDITFDELLAELTARLEQGEEALPDATPTRPADPARDGLVHVSGNHYKLGGMDVWDMNHIPEPSEQQLDANGWPKYLNVPSECPSPRGNTTYLHEAYYNYDGGGDPNHPFFGRSKNSLGDMSSRLNSYFNKGTWYYTSHDVGDPTEGKKSQETTYPFITPNKIGVHFGTHISGGNLAKANEVESVAYCPGDFTGVTPQGETPLPEACKGGVGVFGPKRVNPFIAHKGDTSFKYNCELEPGKRYFHNFRPLRDHKALMEGIDLTQEAASGEWGENTGRTGSHSGNQKAFNAHRPPYANNCISGQGKGDGAFPVNYSGARSFPDGFRQPSDCGRRAPHNISGGSCANHAYRAECYDVTGQLPPVTFQRECVGSEFVWSKGYGKKALSNYVCERFTPNGELYDGAPYHWGGVACAEHRAGEIRKEVAQLRVGASGYVVRNKYQCQFDEDLGRYDWHVIASTKPVNNRNVRHTVTRQVEPPKGAFTFPPPAHKNTCMWEGKEYSLGTEMVQKLGGGTGGYNNKRLGTHKYVCMQRAPAPALPRFTHTELYVSPETPPTVGSAYSVTFEKPTTDAPNCEGRQPLKGVKRDTSIIYDSPKETTNWWNTWQSPLPTWGQKRDIAVDPNTYFAIEFDTTEVESGAATSVHFSHPQFGENVKPGFKMITVSECPGDFTPQTDTNCRAHFSGGSFIWYVGQDEELFCDIEQGKTYYLNVLYTDQSEKDVPDSSPTRYYCTSHSADDQDQQCGNIIMPG